MPKRKKSKVAVAWERAKMHGPRKLGGLIADRATVHARTRNASWSIDADCDLDHGSGGGHRASPSTGSTGLASKEASGEADGPTSTQRSHQAHASQTSLISSLVRTAKHGRSESQVGLLSSPDVQSPSSPPRSSRDSRAQSSPSPNPISRLVSGLAEHFREPPVPVVNGAPRRGFNVDDVDAQSPTSVQDHRASERYVTVAGEQESRQNGMPPFARKGVTLEPLSTVLPVRRLSPISSRHDSEGAGSTEAVVNAGSEQPQETTGREREGPESIMLISRQPGQDFNSMASPVTTDTDGLGLFHGTPTESEHWSAALTDTSSVLLPSFARAALTQPARPDIPPIPPPMSQNYRPLPQPQDLRPPPSSFSSPSSHPTSPPAPAIAPAPIRNLYAQPVGSSTLLPNAGLFPTSPNSSGQAASAASPLSSSVSPLSFSADRRRSPQPLQLQPSERQERRQTYDEPPPSAFTQNTGHSSQAANAGSNQSEHSSSYAYTVPNPFVFDSASGGARGAATALRLASPSRSGDGERSGGSSANPFRRTRSESFDLAG